jgi:hypothetical protein
MASLCMCAMLLLGADRPAERIAPQAPEQVVGGASHPRPMHEIHQDLRATMQKEAEEADAARWAATVARLALLYGEIMRDPRLPDSPTLAGYRVKTRARLLRIQKDLERDLERQGKALSADSLRPQAAASLGREPWEMSLSLGGESAEQLAARLKEVAARWESAPGGAARGDYGPMLVELIRQTIAPEFWDVNGGPGVILYYRPGHALVVRATGDIHERIGGTVDALRK